MLLFATHAQMDNADGIEQNFVQVGQSLLMSMRFFGMFHILSGKTRKVIINLEGNDMTIPNKLHGWTQRILKDKQRHTCPNNFQNGVIF